MNARDNGYTPLHIALKKRHFPVTYHLLSRGCQLGVVKGRGDGAAPRSPDAASRTRAPASSAQCRYLRPQRQCRHAAVLYRPASRCSHGQRPSRTMSDPAGTSDPGRCWAHRAQGALDLGEMAIAQLFPGRGMSLVVRWNRRYGMVCIMSLYPFLPFESNMLLTYRILVNSHRNLVPQPRLFFKMPEVSNQL